MVFLGRKKEGDDLELMMEDEVNNSQDKFNNESKELNDNEKLNVPSHNSRSQVSQKKSLIQISL
jgi:hypothetical protein